MREKLLKIVDNKRHRLLLLLILTPAIWWILFQFNQIIYEWQKAPVYFGRKVSSVFSLSNLRYISELRWETPDYSRNAFVSRLFYNKLTVLVDEFFDLSTFLSPKLYFQQDDEGGLLPSGVESIPAILFPFWIFGILRLIKQRRLKPFLVWFGFGAAAFLVGQRNFNFLFPVVLINLSFVNEGLMLIKDSKKMIFLFLTLFLYNSFLVGRALWLTL